MPFILKWVFDDQQQQSQSFRTQEEAADFACPIIRREPQEIWVEDDRGQRVLIEPAITLRCRSLGRLP